MNETVVTMMLWTKYLPSGAPRQIIRWCIADFHRCRADRYFVIQIDDDIFDDTRDQPEGEDDAKEIVACNRLYRHQHHREDGDDKTERLRAAHPQHQGTSEVCQDTVPDPLLILFQAYSNQSRPTIRSSSSSIPTGWWSYIGWGQGFDGWTSPLSPEQVGFVLPCIRSGGNSV